MGIPSYNWTEIGARLKEEGGFDALQYGARGRMAIVAVISPSGQQWPHRSISGRREERLGRVAFQATLASEGAEVGGVQHRIVFDLATPISSAKPPSTVSG
jgi:hypothetical protein